VFFPDRSETELASLTLDAGGERKLTMLKTIESISEALRNPKHPFRKADFRPKKPQKSRYERRKVKEYLHVTDWMAEEAV
jgi:hypothetical protein